MPSASSEIENLAELVKLDYDHTGQYVDGVVRVSTGIRAIAAAAWLALLGAAFQGSGEWLLALLAAAAVLVLGLIDAYHGWLYASARRRLIAIEGLLEGYYKHLQRPWDKQGELRLLKALRNHRFGQRSGVPALPERFRPAPSPAPEPKLPVFVRRVIRWLERRLVAVLTVAKDARPTVFYRWLYPSLLALALVSVAGIALTGGSGTRRDATVFEKPSEKRTCSPCDTTEGPEGASKPSENRDGSKWAPPPKTAGNR